MCVASITASGYNGAMGRSAAEPRAGTSSDDARLVDRIARGEAAALKALYERYAPRALAIAIRVLRSRPEAEEIVQETFLEVWRRAREFDPARGGIAAWVSTMARSRAIERLRTRAVVDRTSAA